MRLLQVFLRITGPITTDLVEVPAQGGAMTSVTGEHGPQGALGRGDEQSRQVVIGRPAFGAAIGGEASLTLAPAQAGRLPIRQRMERKTLQGINQFARVALDMRLLFRRQGSSEKIG